MATVIDDGTPDPPALELLPDNLGKDPGRIMKPMFAQPPAVRDGTSPDPEP